MYELTRAVPHRLSAQTILTITFMSYPAANYLVIHVRSSLIKYSAHFID